MISQINDVKFKPILKLKPKWKLVLLTKEKYLNKYLCL